MAVEEVKKTLADEVKLLEHMIAAVKDFDGSKSLLLSVIRVVECTPDGVCQETTPGNVGLPQFLKIDFTNKTISPAAAGDDTPATTIERQEIVDGKLPVTADAVFLDAWYQLELTIRTHEIQTKPSHPA